MRLRPSTILTVFLMLSAVFPPGAVVNLWIAGAPLHLASDSSKSVNARARNRVSSTIHVEAALNVSPLGSGEKRPPRPSSLAHAEGRPSPKLHGQASRSAAFPTILRLRC